MLHDALSSSDIILKTLGTGKSDLVKTPDITFGV